MSSLPRPPGAATAAPYDAPPASLLRRWRDLIPLLSGSPDAVLLVGVDSRILAATRALAGLPPEQLEGLPLLSLVPPEERPLVASTVRQAFAPGLSHRIDLPVLADGGLVWYQAGIGPLRNPDGEVEAAVVTAADVTRRKAEEERLRRSERLMVDTQGVAHLGTWEWDLSEPHARWSAELFRIYGLDPSDHVPTYSDYLERVHPGDRERVNAATEAVLRDHRPYSHDERIFRSDGEMRYLHTWAEPVLDRQGRLVRLVGVCQDITERVVAEETLRRRESQLALAHKVAGLASWEWDPESGRVDASDELCRAAGHATEAGQLTPEAFLSLFHPDDRERTLVAMGQVAEGGGTFSLDHRLLSPDGSVRTLATRGEAVEGEGGRVRVVAAGLDISERKAMETRLRKGLKAQEALLQEVHHRVKNNLQIIASLLNLQAVSVGDGAARAGLLQCRHRIHSMALVHDSLYHSEDVSRINFGDYAKSLIMHLYQAYAPAPAHIQLLVDVEDLIFGLDEAVPCGLLLNELIANSLTHAFPGDRHGTLRVRLAAEADGSVTLSVEDDGVGLPPALAAGPQGTLGLTLVATLARQLGANLKVETDGGTRVTITLPRMTKMDAGEGAA